MTDTSNPNAEPCLPMCWPEKNIHQDDCPRRRVTVEPRRRGRPPGTGRGNPRSRGYNQGRRRRSRGF
jgi:hypothetical protein